jgi:hypothetical protein
VDWREVLDLVVNLGLLISVVKRENGSIRANALINGFAISRAKRTERCQTGRKNYFHGNEWRFQKKARRQEPVGVSLW